MKRILLSILVFMSMMSCARQKHHLQVVNLSCQTEARWLKRASEKAMVIMVKAADKDHKIEGFFTGKEDISLSEATPLFYIIFSQDIEAKSVVLTKP